MIPITQETLGDLIGVCQLIFLQNTNSSDMSSIGGNVRYVRKFGLNESVSTTEVSIWDEENLYPWSEFDSAISLQVRSADANDTSGGTGAQTIYIDGVGDDGEFKGATLTMNGTSYVDAGDGWKGVNSMWVITCGSTGGNVGKITCETSGAVVVSALRAPVAGVVSYNRTQQAVFTVPSNWTCFEFGAEFRYNTSSSRTGDMNIYMRPGGASNVAFQNIDTAPLLADGVDYGEVLPFPIYIPPGSNIEGRGHRTSGSGSASYKMFFNLLLIRTTYLQQ